MVGHDEYFDIYNGRTERGTILYNNPEKKISFGLLEDNNYLIIEGNRNYIIKRDSSLMIGLLPLLEIDALSIKTTIEKNGLNFYEIVPVEKILLTAFDDGFSSSIYWKEKSLNWMEKLNYSSPIIINMLLNKSIKNSNLPKDFKLKIRNLAIQLKKTIETDPSYPIDN